MAQERGIGQVSNSFINHRSPPELDLSKEEQYFVDDIDWWPRCEPYNDRMEIDDPVWGYEEIGTQKYDYILLELAANKALDRLRHIEQLTLPRNYTTIPNTSLFSRWEHVWGSVVLTRKLIRKNNELNIEGSEGHIDPDTALKMQIRTLLSDTGHTSGSHLGDWLFQDDSNSEDLHDINLKSFLERVGVNNILRLYNIDPDEVIFPPGQDWIEADAPALCVDRIDYSLREMRRWIPNEKLKSINVDDFHLTADGQIYMTDIEKAKLFAEAYLILSQEHWNDPVHRLQLELFKTRLQRVIATTTGQSGLHPLAQLMGTDRDIAIAMQQKGIFEDELDTIMEDIGRVERKLGWDMRVKRIARILEFGEYEFSGTELMEVAFHHPMISVENEEKYTEDNACISFNLPHLKFRHIDPRILIDVSLVPLSQIDEGFKGRLEANKKFVLTNYVGKVAFADRVSREYVSSEIDALREEWANVTRMYKMTPEALDDQVINAIKLAA
jgi:HD superfamily phosphohydrolase